MSELHFFDSSDEVPVPRDQVAIESATFEPYPDGRRVLVGVTLTPFTDRPNLEIALLAPDGRQVSSLTIVEALERQMEFTLHIRERATLPQYTGRVELRYEDDSAQQVVEVQVDMQPAAGKSKTP